jgi:hypothetical protein
MTFLIIVMLNIYAITFLFIDMWYVSTIFLICLIPVDIVFLCEVRKIKERHGSLFDLDN